MIHTVKIETHLPRDHFEEKRAVLEQLTPHTKGVKGHYYDPAGNRHEFENIEGFLGPALISLRRGSQRALVHIASATDLLRDGDPRLLLPSELTRLSAPLDKLLAPFGLEPVRSWRVRRVDFAYDFPRSIPRRSRPTSSRSRGAAS